MGKAFESLKADCASKAEDSSKYCKVMQKEVLEKLDVMIKDYKYHLNLRQAIAHFEIDKYRKAKQSAEEGHGLYENAIKVLDETIEVYNVSPDRSNSFVTARETRGPD